MQILVLPEFLEYLRAEPRGFLMQPATVPCMLPAVVAVKVVLGGQPAVSPVSRSFGIPFCVNRAGRFVLF